MGMLRSGQASNGIVRVARLLVFAVFTTADAQALADSVAIAGEGGGVRSRATWRISTTRPPGRVRRAFG